MEMDLHSPIFPPPERFQFLSQGICVDPESYTLTPEEAIHRKIQHDIEMNKPFPKKFLQLSIPKREDEPTPFEEFELDERRSSAGSASKSIETASSYDETKTPVLPGGFDFGFRRSVQGPRGPHLFRSSQSSSEISFHLSLSPLTPAPVSLPTALLGPASPKQRPLSTYDDASGLEQSKFAEWTAYQVELWLVQQGVEADIAAKFRENDVSGSILQQITYEDLKELDIPSFGKRHEIWTKINSLRGTVPAKGGHSRNTSNCTTDSENSTASKSTLNYPWRIDAAISPLDRGSIVGVERLLPREHKCHKGENCSKWRRQAKQRALMRGELPVSPGPGGEIIISSLLDAPMVRNCQPEDLLSPVGGVLPSVVASSDVLGLDRPPMQLQEKLLLQVASRDPQDNVKQFLDFQHVRSQSTDPEPLEMFPPLANPIPQGFQGPVTGPRRLSGLAKTVKRPQPLQDLTRFATPASEADTPVTLTEFDLASRDHSRSVPPQPTPPIFGHTRSRSLQAPEVQHSVRRRSFSHSPVWQQPVPEERAVDIAEPEVDETPRRSPHEGWMKKRKTGWLRHEWQERYFALNGTKLTVHKDHRKSKELEALDIDDYTVAVSNIATGKLGTALKTMKLGRQKEVDSTAFAFQLMPSRTNSPLGRSYHFAVKNKDERLDWMRELMIAKAIKRGKTGGYEVNMNGTMI